MVDKTGCPCPKIPAMAPSMLFWTDKAVALLLTDAFGFFLASPVFAKNMYCIY